MSVDEDVTYLHNLNKHLPLEEQKELCEYSLAVLDTPAAAAQYTPVDIVYMRKVWTEVRKKIEAAERTKQLADAGPVVGNKRFTKRWDA